MVIARLRRAVVIALSALAIAACANVWGFRDLTGDGGVGADTSVDQAGSGSGSSGAGGSSGGGSGGSGSSSGSTSDGGSSSGSSGSGSGSSSGSTSSSGAGSGSGSSSGESGSSSGSSSSGSSGSSSGWGSCGSSGSSGGGDDAGDDEGGVTSTGLSVLYQVGASAAMDVYFGCTLSVLNSGTTPVDVSGLEARYYFVAGGYSPQVDINWSHVSTPGSQPDLTVTTTVEAFSPATANADTYIAFDFSSSSHPMLATGESAVFAWEAQSPNTASDQYNQTEAYSFNAMDTAPMSWTHVPLFQNGTLVWGAVP